METGEIHSQLRLLHPIDGLGRRQTKCTLPVSGILLILNVTGSVIARFGRARGTAVTTLFVVCPRVFQDRNVKWIRWHTRPFTPGRMSPSIDRPARAVQRRRSGPLTRTVDYLP